MLTRSHGLGNDYLVADPLDLPFELTPERVRLLCDRHFGVGSDGLLVLDGRDPWRLRIINPDGSEAEKSGNGLRIFSKWLFDTGRTQAEHFPIVTPGGTVQVRIHAERGRAREVTVDMGVPIVRRDLSSLDIDGEVLPVVALSIGNPHCVVPRQRLDRTELLRLGPRIETHAAFPNRTNVQLARAVDRTTVELLIWERGAGETQASGSSSCAAVAALHHLGWVDEHVVARMPGGDLSIRIDQQGSLWMRGPVEEVATITLSPDLLDRLRALP